VRDRIRSIVKGVTPPLLWSLARRLRPAPAAPNASPPPASAGQDLALYWDPQMAALLETWGEGNAWHEIRLLLTGRSGKVLDIACGTGRVMDIVGADASLEVHGCDISDYLIGKAAERGIPRERLTVCDATHLPYQDGRFDHAYSIGSLEHFTEEGIEQVLAGCRRTVRGLSFHMVPVSRSGADEGWITPYQAYFNNSVGWWMERALRSYPRVTIADSIWSDERSVGKWLVCARD
jgi:SAM-dependent methyltransferase